MESIRFKTRVGPDGVLRLEVPLPLSSRDLDVVLVYGPTETKTESESVRSSAGRGWSEDFFTEVAGGWKGETLVRPPQGSFESRPPLK